MAIINEYDNDGTINAEDKLIGSDGAVGVDYGKTKNYTIASIASYISSEGLSGGAIMDRLIDAADDTDAAGQGVALGGIYRTGNALKIRIV